MSLGPWVSGSGFVGFGVRGFLGSLVEFRENFSVFGIYFCLLGSLFGFSRTPVSLPRAPFDPLMLSLEDKGRFWGDALGRFRF